ncbi:MAG: DinB family protein [Vicinamibacterales bacterium]
MSFPKSDYKTRILALAGDGDVRAMLAESGRRIVAVFARLDGKWDRSYGPGKWTARELACHLADAEMAIGYRLRQALADDDHRIQPFDEQQWAARYSGLDPTVARAAFEAMRRWNLTLAATCSAADLARPAFHPERGPEPVEEILRMLAGHDLNHLAQLTTIADG